MNKRVTFHNIKFDSGVTVSVMWDFNTNEYFAFWDKDGVSIMEYSQSPIKAIRKLRVSVLKKTNPNFKAVVDRMSYKESLSDDINRVFKEILHRRWSKSPVIYMNKKTAKALEDRGIKTPHIIIDEISDAPDEVFDILGEKYAKK